MKLHKSLMGLMAGVAIALSVTSCDPGAVDPADGSMPVYAQTTETTSFELLAQPADFQDATLEQEMRERPDPRGGDDKRGPKVRHPFGRLLNALNLTEEQRTQVAELLEKHKACADEAMSVLKEHNSELIAKAREERDAIKAKVEAGEMTREEARAAIRALNERLRNALKESGIRERVREMLKSCDDEFLRALAQILTEEQRAILERFLASRPS